MKRAFFFFFALLIGMPAALPASAATLLAGDLIKASGPAVYYYADDGKRYVFPTEKTYKSWYVDFSGVTTITDMELAAIQIGGNVTYRPGVRLVKVTTDPRVYAVDGGQLRWITSEAVAAALFGDSWATQVDDIPDPFFVNYTIGSDIAATGDYSPSDVRTTFASIQAVITHPDAAPSELTETPEEDPSPSTEPSVLSLTTDTQEAQANESFSILAQAPADSGITSITLSIDHVGQLTTCASFSCTATWMIPPSGTLESYTIRAVAMRTGGSTIEETTVLPVVQMPITALARITANRFVLKPTQFPNIRAFVNPDLRPTRTDIVIDDVPMKTCSDTPTDCPYIEYFTGPIGTSYNVYARIWTSDALTYKSPTVTFTLAENDAPLLTFSVDQPSILVGETVGMSLMGEDDDGIDRVEIYHEATLLKTCLGAAPCTVTTGPWNVAAGTVLTFTGRAWDLKGTQSESTVHVTVQSPSL